MNNPEPETITVGNNEVTILGFPAQQGDVEFLRIAALPEGLKEAETDARGLVFANGEHTGHFHGANGGAGVMFEDELGNKYARVDEEMPVGHQEHDNVDVPPDIYMIKIVVEVDPFTQAIERVRD